MLYLFAHRDSCLFTRSLSIVDVWLASGDIPCANHVLPEVYCRFWMQHRFANVKCYQTDNNKPLIMSPIVALLGWTTARACELHPRADVGVRIVPCVVRLHNCAYMPIDLRGWRLRQQLQHIVKPSSSPPAVAALLGGFKHPYTHALPMHATCAFRALKP